MEFNEKLHELRNKKGLTQQELAQKLYVSRTAISKWESGRGYPSIDSLRDIAKFFSITVDELISPCEALDIAEKDGEQKKNHVRDLIYGLLDMCAALFFFVPFFAARLEDAVKSASLIGIGDINPIIKGLYYILIISLILYGILTLAMQNVRAKAWVKVKGLVSLIISAALVVLFIVGLQPYAAVFTFILLVIKALILIKWH